MNPPVETRRDHLRALAQAVHSAAAPRSRTQQPLRVAVVGMGGVGGSGKVAGESARSLAAAGHSVRYLSGPGTHWTGGVPHVALPVPPVPGPPDARAEALLAAALLAELERAPVEVLVVHYAGGLLRPALAARQKVAAAGHRTAVVAVLHGSDVTGPHVEVGPLREALESCDGVVAVSHWLARQARARLNLARPVEVVTNSFDAKRFLPGRGEEVRSHLLAGADAFLVGHVSNHRPVKRAVDAVRVAAGLRAEGLPVHLVVIGDGPGASEVLREVARQGLGSHATLTGILTGDALADHVAALDLTLVTSETESFSLAALESLACGVPVVGTRCGGLEELFAGIGALDDIRLQLAADRLDLLTEVGDTTSMSASAAALLRRSSLWRSLSRAGAHGAREAFGVARQHRAMLQVVERAVAPPSSWGSPRLP